MVIFPLPREKQLNRSEAKKEIQSLVEKFEEHYDSYKASSYNEATLRIDFLNKFFHALGWDIENEASLPPSLREVVTEDSVKVEGRSKSPDYSFKINGRKRAFFLEAKKSAVDVSKHLDSSLQVRRYGWSAGLAVSLLSSFEYLAVYDCTLRLKENDKVSRGRLKLIHYKEYLDKFDYIWEHFSHEAVHRGAINKAFGENQIKKGAQSIDKDFLESLNEWRESLALDLFKNNNLDGDKLNFVVQQIIDRIIFLRIAEDRDVEQYGNLLERCKSEEPFSDLLLYFIKSDSKYNSGLFKQHELIDSCNVSKKVITKILKNLYYPANPYEFSVLPIEILGRVYEQFLGKRILVNEKNKIEIEYKPEVRKAGGVYYTDERIVDFIVDKTLGPILKNKKPKDIENIRVLDPACGSGSFLIGAFQYLLDWHLEYYTKNPPKKSKKKESPLTNINTLTSSEKKRILTNNIFGVDIDLNAVEVTKLSLLLKCLEGETDSSIQNQLSLFGEKVLPTLDENILCGNSLIGLDYSLKHIDFDEDLKVNPFSWEYGFKKIFKKQGGFDVVIGNPPWGADFFDNELDYLRRKYTSVGSKVDSYAVFTEKSMDILKDKGELGFIIPDTYLRKDGYTSFRKLMFDSYQLSYIVEAGPLFPQVRDTWCSIVFFYKSNVASDSKSKITHKKLSRTIVSVEERLLKFGEQDWDIETELSQSNWRKSDSYIVGYKATNNDQKIIRKLGKFTRLGELDCFSISRGEEGSKLKIKESSKGQYKMIIPADIEKNYVGDGVSVTQTGLTKNKITNIYDKPKIWIIRIQKMRWIQRIVSAVDSRVKTAGMKTLQSITHDQNDVNELYYLQGLLSSKLMNYWCINFLADDLNQSYLEKFPVKYAFSKNELKKKEQIIENVAILHELNKNLLSITLESKKKVMLRKIEHLQSSIDQCVYELYSLNTSEFSAIEKGCNEE